MLTVFSRDAKSRSLQLQGFERCVKPFLRRQNSYQFFYQNASKMRSRIDSRNPKCAIWSSFTTPLISPYVTRRKTCLLSGSIAADLGPSGNSPGHQPEVSGVTACGVARWGKCRDHGSDALWPADLRMYRMFMPRCGSFDIVRVCGPLCNWTFSVDIGHIKRSFVDVQPATFDCLFPDDPDLDPTLELTSRGTCPSSKDRW